MTKKICFVLVLAIVGIAGVNAQMRIGGSDVPNQSAVLDLNPDNNVSSGNATLGLALPRVNLRNSGDAFPLLSHVKGMAVYNMATIGDVTPGVYINNGAKWLRQLDSNTPVSVAGRDSIVGNEVVDATLGGGLIRDGEGTEISPYTLGIATSGVTTDKIADQSVTPEKLSDSTIDELREKFSFVFDYYNPVFEQRVVNLIHENEKDGVVGNEVTDATIGGGLIRDGEGTEISPYTLGITEGGVTTNKIANQSVTYEKLSEDAIAELRDKFSFVFDYYNPVFEQRVVNLIRENEKDGVVGNEVTDATIGGGLIRGGEGTEISPYTLGIAESGVTTDKIAGQSVTYEKLSEEAISELRDKFSFVFDYYDPLFEERVINLINEHEQDGVIGNEVVGATDGSLKRSGEGTAESPYTLSVSESGIETKHLRNGAVTTDKITDNAISTRHIENRSVTMEKLSEDVLNELHVKHPVNPEDLMPSTPNSILVSDAYGQWRTQKVTGDEIICFYEWKEEHSTGWINLGYPFEITAESIPAGLYSAHIHINNSGSTVPIDCVVVDAGPQSTYTFPRKNSEARGVAVSVESGLIYKTTEIANIRMYLHIPGTTRHGLAAIVLNPIIQLH